MKLSPINGAGKYYKGAMHTHTLRSDGSKTPRQLVDYYKSQGFDFVAITDHHSFWDSTEFDTDDFCVLHGMEIGISFGSSGYDVPFELRDRTYHLNVYLDYSSEYFSSHPAHDEWWFTDGFGGLLKPPSASTNGRYTVNFDYSDSLSAHDAIQRLIDMFRRRGCLVTLNHPEWGRLTERDCVGFDGLFAIEIFNRGADMATAGSGVRHWDAAMRHGAKLCGVAADDNHGDFRPEAVDSYVMVKAESLTPESITAALKAGNFYSTQGPEIGEFWVDDGYAFASSSPAQSISFVCYESRGLSVHAAPGGYVSKAFLPIGTKAKFVRLEVADRFGRTAWSNAVFPPIIDKDVPDLDD